MCNINFDPLKNIELHCAKTPSTVEYLAGDGTWQEAHYTAADGVIKLDYSLGCYELVILRIN